jgi:hypothetical protein
MTRIIIVVLVLAAIHLEGTAQTLVGSKPAKLQVYAMTEEGTELTATSDNLAVLYDNLVMTGMLPVYTLMANSDEVSSLLEMVVVEEIKFHAVLPEGHFVFGSSMHEQFSAEADLHSGEHTSRIMLEFDVTNNKSNNANIFQIICTGKLSLSNDLGVGDRHGLQDEIRFQFNQNVTSKKM